MKKILFSLAFLFSASMMASCHQMTDGLVKSLTQDARKHDYKDSKERGPVVERTIQVSSFDELDLSGCAKVIYTQGNNIQVKLRGNEKDLEKYEVKVKDGELHIGIKSHGIKVNGRSPRLTAYITAPTLRDIDMSGACDLQVPQKASFANKLDIEVSGAGDLDITDMEVESLDLDVSGAGDVSFENLKAKKDVDIEVSGAGDVKGKVEAQDVDVELSGAGDVALTVDCDNLKGSASGAADLTLKGKCRTFHKSKSGAASVKTKGLKVTFKVTGK